MKEWSWFFNFKVNYSHSLVKLNILKYIFHIFIREKKQYRLIDRLRMNKFASIIMISIARRFVKSISFIDKIAMPVDTLFK